MHSPVPAGQHLLTTELLLVLKTKSKQLTIYSVRSEKKLGETKKQKKCYRLCPKGEMFPSQRDIPSPDWEDRKIRGLYQWENMEPR